MNIEKDLIITILKFTVNGSILNEQVYKNVKIPQDIALNLLKKLEKEGLIYLHNNLLKADSFQRLKLAVYAAQLGADLEHVCSFLGWREFEQVVVMAFERNGYEVVENFRFKHAGRRWEIDVVGWKKPLVVCVDCKHWRRGLYPSALKKIVERQVERSFAFSASLKAFERFGFASWDKAKVVPAVLSLVPSRFKFYGGVPVIPVFQLQDFLAQLPVHVDELKFFEKSLSDEFNGCS
ncbi:MAG: restriction endonuclease [Candidatus Bathyarchaeales archaeon]